MAQSCITTLPPNVRTALGMTDPFGKQYPFYTAALKILQREYGARISYHELKPDWVKIEQVAKATKREAKTNMLGLWTLKVRTLALQQIEGAPKKVVKEHRTVAASDVAAQILKRLGG